MVDIPSIIVTGAMISAVYALIAIGFTMIFGVGGILNIAHGALLMIGAYTYLFATRSEYPIVVGLIGGVAIAAILSYGIYRVLIQVLEDDPITVFMATLILAILIQEVIRIPFSSQTALLVPLVDGSIPAFGTRIRMVSIVAFVVSWVVILALWYFVNRTMTGRDILALSMSERGALVTGVDTGRVQSLTWLISGALAGLAGIFLGMVESVSPEMWLSPLALAFIIVIVGGIGSIRGSIAAAYLIGYIETLTVSLGGPSYRGFVSMVILLAVILVRPEGLFGREYIE